jgi:hypothetical protein
MSAIEPASDGRPDAAANTAARAGSEADASEWVRRIPRQLTGQRPRFVGREDLLARASDLLGGDVAAPPRVVVLTGPPGSGRTSAALQLASRRPTSFPGGEVFVDLHARTAHDGLRACVRSYGVPEDLIPQNVPELNALYRRCTAGAAALVVVDNATEPAQVYPFVPTAGGSVVIVTSGDPLSELVSQVDAVPVTVPPLNAEQGTAMLAGLCGAARLNADPAASAELVRLCGGLPAALTTAGRWLAARRSRSVGELVGAVAARATDAMSALFCVACEDLSEQDARLYRRLSVLPVVDFDERLAQEATATTGSPARLAALALLVDEGGGRYHFPSLAARHATEQAMANETAGEHTVIARRAMQFYARRTALAERTVLGQGRSRSAPMPEAVDGPWRGLAPMAWLEAERLNLLEIVRDADRCGWYDEAWRLSRSLTALHWASRRRAEWVAAGSIGARAAHQVGNRQVEALLRTFTANALLDMGFVDRAGRELEQALPVAQDCGEQRLLAAVWETTSRLRGETGDAAGAIASHRQATAHSGDDDHRDAV